MGVYGPFGIQALRVSVYGVLLMVLGSYLIC